MNSVGHSITLVPSLWRVFLITLSSQTDMPILTTVTLNKRYAFKETKTVHINSSSSSPPSFLDITPALQEYLSFPLSFTHQPFYHTHIHSLFHNYQTNISNPHLKQTQTLQLSLLNPPLLERRTLLNPWVVRVVEAIHSIHK